YGSKGDESIKLFVGGRCLAGSKAVAARLNDAVAAELAAGSATFVPPPPGQDGGAGGEGQLFAEILSRFSRTPDASVRPALKKDALKQWRAASHPATHLRQVPLPLSPIHMACPIRWNEKGS
ncbi:MAG TPA: hypothetical protein VMZ50_09780, partial [Phycisphaerae bacterium]|nr:hypothetical protein [Phycisphaerae bacterium]